MIHKDKQLILVLEYVDMDLKYFLNTRESPLDNVVVKVLINLFHIHQIESPISTSDSYYILPQEEGFAQGSEALEHSTEQCKGNLWLDYLIRKECLSLLTSDLQERSGSQ